MVTIIKKGTPIKEIRKKIDEIIAKTSRQDLLKYAGKLKTEIDPLEYQKQMRDEWQIDFCRYKHSNILSKR